MIEIVKYNKRLIEDINDDISINTIHSPTVSYITLSNQLVETSTNKYKYELSRTIILKSLYPI